MSQEMKHPFEEWLAKTYEGTGLRHKVLPGGTIRALAEEAEREGRDPTEAIRALIAEAELDAQADAELDAQADAELDADHE